MVASFLGGVAEDVVSLARLFDLSKSMASSVEISERGNGIET